MMQRKPTPFTGGRMSQSTWNKTGLLGPDAKSISVQSISSIYFFIQINVESYVRK